MYATQATAAADTTNEDAPFFWLVLVLIIGIGALTECQAPKELELIVAFWHVHSYSSVVLVHGSLESGFWGLFTGETFFGGGTIGFVVVLEAAAAGLELEEADCAGLTTSDVYFLADGATVADGLMT